MEQSRKFDKHVDILNRYREIKLSERKYLHIPQLTRMKVEEQFLSYYLGSVPKWRLLLRRLISEKRIQPNFAIVGPIKSGSTDLSSHLLLHPNIMPPLAKEFALDDREMWRIYYPREIEKEKLLNKTQYVKTGYFAPDMHNLRLIDGLHKISPDTKIIIILRDPVERAWSHWKWEVFLAGKKVRENTILQEFSKFVKFSLDIFPYCPTYSYCNFPLLQTGIYHKAVELWLNRFGEDNVLVLNIGEYFSDRQPFLEQVQEFLDIPVVDIPASRKKINENPLKLGEADIETLTALDSFYRPENEKLFELIKKDFNWHLKTC